MVAMVALKISRKICATLTSFVIFGSSWAIFKVRVCIELDVFRAVKIISSGLLTLLALVVWAFNFVWKKKKLLSQSAQSWTNMRPFWQSSLVKPNYFKKQSSSSSFLLEPKGPKWPCSNQQLVKWGCTKQRGPVQTSADQRGPAQTSADQWNLE